MTAAPSHAAIAIATAVTCACALAACGDNLPRVEPPPPTGCAAAFSENFAETSVSPGNCARIAADDSGHAMLTFEVRSTTIDAPFQISIDLGEAPSAGSYTSQSLATPWQASALHEFEMTSCLYHAGTAAVPPGTFQLALDEVDEVGGGDEPARAHGKLDVVLYVLARPYTYCGETNIEHLAVTF